MNELNSVVAKNISALRASRGLTQAELAEKLDYSDKSVSKWERGESVPDASVLLRLAELFGVSVDYLLHEHASVPAPERVSKRIRLIIASLSALAVWFAATVVYVSVKISDITPRPWLIFVVCVPLTAVVFLIFNSIWHFAPKLNYVILTVLCWSFFGTVYLFVLERNFWLVFTIGIPLQIAIILCANLTGGKRKK